ncbi:MAG: TlyA family RNA methyltransferase [Rhodoferax sp.]|nr:TlyA family RNA methyltransferase [Rhodoferax sp.]
MRIDQLLVQRGLASTRSQAQRLIAAGVQWHSGSGWRRVVKNGDDVDTDAAVELLDAAEARFVSRGGLKLEGVLQRLGLSVAGAFCLDVGQSTGGFTDCLLQHGAASVTGIDVGFGQLHEQLRRDPRVNCVERVNARYLSAQDLLPVLPDLALPGNQVNPVPWFDVVVGDLSFISQTLVLPAVVPWLKVGGALLMLVKPQFELQPGQVGKGGIVTDDRLLAVVERRLRAAHAALRMKVQAYVPSVIDGGDGNREFFIHSILEPEPLP